MKNKIIAISVSLICILIPAYFLLEWFGVMPLTDITSAELLVIAAGMVCAIFCIYTLCLQRNLDILSGVSFIAILYMIVNTIFAKDAELALQGNSFSYEGLLVNLSYIFICDALCRLERKNVKIVYLSIVSVGILELVIGFLQAVLHIPFWVAYQEESVISAFGTFQNSNPYGTFMAILAAMECGFVFNGKSQKWQHICLLAAFFAGLMMSDCLGGVVGFLAAVLLCIIVYLWRSHGKRATVLVSAGIAVTLIICMLIAAIWILKKSSEENVAIFDLVNNISNGRLNIWKRVWEVFKTSPLLGVGIANLKLVYFVGSDMHIVYVAHNEYLDILATQGIIGLGLFWAYLLSKFLTAIKNNKFKDNPFIYAVIAYLFAGFFEWRIIYLTIYVYIIFGMMVAYSHNNDLKENQK